MHHDLRALGRLAAAILFGASVFSTFSASSAYDIVNRWSATQVDGGGLQRGDPINLRWSIVPDGQSYSRSNNSNLIQFLDDAWSVPQANRLPNLRNRPWWSAMNSAYSQFGRVSGINMIYVAEQNADGSDTGMEGDVRIGGEVFGDGPGGALADNVFPDNGDMRIDTTREANGSIGFYFATEPGLRNLVIHETGHGVGLGHAQFVNNSAKAVMEGGLRTDIWGLQFDDVYALNRQYGDPKERDGGNNSSTTATQLANFTTSGSLSVGLDAADSVVERFDDDWLGIDGRSDIDWFRFTVTDGTFANLKITPIGPTYETVQQGVFNAAAQNDLVLQLYRNSPTLSALRTKNDTSIGEAEEITAQYLPGAGDYLIRVIGRQDANQFYRIDLSLNELPVPGTSADVNLDGSTSITDWETFVEYSYSDLSELTPKESFARGDLDLDGDNDLNDFRLFKTAYNAANGPNAFALLTGVPEPSAAALAGIAVLAALSYRGRRRI